jgi:hypothetical protein
LNGGINLFAYVGANPINAIDPWGLVTHQEFLDHQRKISQEYQKRLDAQAAALISLIEETPCVTECMFTNYPLLIPGAVAESVVIAGATIYSGGEAALLITSVGAISDTWTVYQFYEAIKDCRQRCKCND